MKTDYIVSDSVCEKFEKASTEWLNRYGFIQNIDDIDRLHIWSRFISTKCLNDNNGISLSNINKELMDQFLTSLHNKFMNFTYIAVLNQCIWDCCDRLQININEAKLSTGDSFYMYACESLENKVLIEDSLWNECIHKNILSTCIVVECIKRDSVYKDDAISDDVIADYPVIEDLSRRCSCSQITFLSGIKSNLRKIYSHSNDNAYIILRKTISMEDVHDIVRDKMIFPKGWEVKVATEDDITKPGFSSLYVGCMQENDVSYPYINLKSHDKISFKSELV